MFLARLRNTAFSRARKRRLVRLVIDALNSGDYDTVANCLAEDVMMSDASGHALVGRDNFIEADRQLRSLAVGAWVQIDSIQFRDRDILLRGHFENAPDELSGKTMWRVGFRDDQIAAIDVTRAAGSLTLPQFAAQRLDSAEAYGD